MHGDEGHRDRGDRRREADGAAPPRDASVEPSSAARTKTENWARFERVRATIGVAARALGAPVAPMKGAWLVARGLRHAADRPMRDADLLVTERTLPAAARRLVRAGFELVDVPRAFGVLSFRLPEAGAPWLDLHARPLPPGIGRLPASRLFEQASEDTVTFGAPVWLPEPAIMAVQLIGNVLKDRLVHAHGEAPRDLDAVLRAEPGLPPRVAALAAGAGLRDGAMLVVEWAAQLRPSDEIEALGAALSDHGAERARAVSRLTALRWLESRAPAASRLLSRAVADSAPQRLLGLASATAGNLVHPLRRRALMGLIGS